MNNLSPSKAELRPEPWQQIFDIQFNSQEDVYARTDAIMLLFTRYSKAEALAARLDEVDHTPDNFFQMRDGEQISIKERRGQLLGQEGSE